MCSGSTTFSSYALKKNLPVNTLHLNLFLRGFYDATETELLRGETVLIRTIDGNPDTQDPTLQMGASSAEIEEHHYFKLRERFCIPITSDPHRSP